MILIADSGSTKCSWAVCDSNGEIKEIIKTIGFNPNFINKEIIINNLNDSKLIYIKNKISQVYFYGAGCSSEDNNNFIKRSLETFFKNANINVNHDINGACYAMYNGKNNITCILGTGSNSCFYDGNNIIEYAPSLGYIIGDEGSGNRFGKEILNMYFNKRLPEELNQKFKKKYEINIDKLKEKIYKNSRPNMYLATFFPFISENKRHPLINEIIDKILEDFFQIHIMCFKDFKKLEVNFTGSVAFYLKEEIYKKAKQYNLQIGNIVQDPIKRLILYHFNKNDN